jgi:hypothetical protein
MIICFNCAKETKLLLDSLISSGQYSNYAEAIEGAITNLVALSNEVNSKGTIVIEDMKLCVEKEILASTKERVIPTIRNRAVTKSSSSNTSVPLSTYSSSKIPAIPQMLSLEALIFSSIEFSPTLHFDATPEREYALDRWLFGQYNKLLPLKVTCRALARMLSRFPQGVALASTIHEISCAAAELGDYLVEHDRKHGLIRDDAIATAFPRACLDADKGLMRYGNHFVGSISNNGQSSGMPIDYGMARIIMDDTPQIILTRAGWEFAALPNPVLENKQTSPEERFSEEEIVFLLEHVRYYLPIEHFTFHTLLHAITSGADTPNKLDNALAYLVPKETNRSLSPSFLASQRSGAISRMADLKLISRMRKGVRVFYEITQEGKDFVTETINNGKESLA